MIWTILNKSYDIKWHNIYNASLFLGHYICDSLYMNSEPCKKAEMQ